MLYSITIYSNSSAEITNKLVILISLGIFFFG